MQLWDRPSLNMNSGCKRTSGGIQPAWPTWSGVRFTRQSRITEAPMAEFIRSGLIILMGLTVMAAGVLVIFYG